MEKNFYINLFLYLAIVAWFLIPGKSDHQKLAEFLEFCLREGGPQGLEKGIQDLINDRKAIDKDKKFAQKAFLFIKFKIQISLFKNRINKKLCQKLMTMVRKRQVSLGFLPQTQRQGGTCDSNR